MAKKTAKVTDISLELNQKQQFRIDGDDNRIIELDVSDITVIHRLREVYPKLNDLGIKGFDIDDSADDTEGQLDSMITALNAIDKEMRDIIDYVFDSKISDICLPTGAMYNMRNGQFVFERILDVLFSLYAENIQSEFGKMSARMKAHTDKYTGK